MFFKHISIAIFMAALAVGGACNAQQAAPAETTPDDARVTAFQEAAFSGKSDIVLKMLDDGISVNGISADKKSALMLAAFNGHEDTVRILMKGGADVALRDEVGRTALMYASTIPSPGTVRLLLDGGSDVNQRDTGEGFTALMFAAAEGNNDVVQLLLDAGADPGIKDVDGDTALDFATKREQVKTIEILNAHAAKSRPPPDAQVEEPAPDTATDR